MLTTMPFDTPFGFVVWTVSCLYDLPVQSLHLPCATAHVPVVAAHGITACAAGLARDYHGVPEASPNLSSSTATQSELTLRQPIGDSPYT